MDPSELNLTGHQLAPTERSQSIIDQLVSLQYECVSCLNRIRHDVAIWSCNECFCIFHLYCIKKWSKQDESGSGSSFRCPHCQVLQTSVSRYFCFCGKLRDPTYDPHITPHSCGQMCGKERPFCTHPCTLQCHPGPCPDCSNLSGPNACPCGSTSYTWQCGVPDPQKTCQNICSKVLNCGIHKCSKVCHWDDCEPCSEKVRLQCFCQGETRELPCGSPVYSCERVCGRKLRCNIHFCELTCHSDACPPCERDPSLITSCPCGSTPLKTPRLSCTDPIPTCGKICGRVLDCGRHNCVALCHTGVCAPCKARSLTRCLCGLTQLSLTCKEQPGYRCNKPCKTKMSCGKHECRVQCCPSRKKLNDISHECHSLCNKKLPCGHECLEYCHRGLCPPCAHVVAERLFCRCGAEMLMPPQPCGTYPPKCTRPCTMIPSCGHPPTKHDCHYDDCPPCMYPVERMCAGGHKLLNNVPCSGGNISCNSKCDKFLVCGHQCSRVCHVGECVDADHKCPQSCGKIHTECGHACNAKCHETKDCPPCTEKVERHCECGRQVHLVSCKKFMQLLSSDSDSPNLIQLKCNADCLFEQRLSLLANRGKVTRSPPKETRYSIFLWDIAMKNPGWVRTVEKHLDSFVKSDASSKSLPAMNREKRALVHALSLYYHIRSESFDSEPNRNCILTKTTKTKLPVLLLGDAVNQPDKHDPSRFLSEMDDTLVSKRAICMRGDIVSEKFVSRTLQDYSGEFVAEEVGLMEGGTKQMRVFFVEEAKQKEVYGYLRRTKPPFHFFIPSSSENCSKEKKKNTPISWNAVFSSNRTS